VGGVSIPWETPAVTGVDHLVYAAPDLRRGMDAIETLLGVRPIPGGRHPSFGTHNALLSLGAATYLEVLAPDPDLPRPERGALFEEQAREGPRLVTWVARSEAIEGAVDALRAAGFDPGVVEEGRRRRPDGTMLSWRLSDPYAMPLGGAVPFVIAWGETPHPASAAPSGGRLIALRIEHPEPARVHQALDALGMELDVRPWDRVRLAATIETAEGIVELR
jgi:hypothetical protein